MRGFFGSVPGDSIESNYLKYPPPYGGSSFAKTFSTAIDSLLIIFFLLLTLVICSIVHSTYGLFAELPVTGLSDIALEGKHGTESTRMTLPFNCE